MRKFTAVALMVVSSAALLLSGCKVLSGDGHSNPISVAPGATPTDAPSATPSDTPSDTPSGTPSETPSGTPSGTPPSSTPIVPPAVAAPGLLHSFVGSGFPQGSLIQSGNIFYGMSTGGGINSKGAIFSLDMSAPSAPVYTVIHSFDLTPYTNGAFPTASLVLSGSTLYGMAGTGGSSSKGVLFSVGTDGTGYTVLHNFAGGVSDGQGPAGSLIISGTTLYGMTGTGGAAPGTGYGVVFSCAISGGSCTITLLHAFTGTSVDGSEPYGDLLLSDGILYGMTKGSGLARPGTIFSLPVGGGSLTLLHAFTGGVSDGMNPGASLTLSGSTLYGTTTFGGGTGCTSSKGCGTVFSIGKDGTGYSILHSFSGTDGGEPGSTLALSGSSLIGMTSKGGNLTGACASSGCGTIFSIGLDGTGFTNQFAFTGSATDGNSPSGSPIVSDGWIYGMTTAGGATDKGVIFRSQIQ